MLAQVSFGFYFILQALFYQQIVSLTCELHLLEWVPEELSDRHFLVDKWNYKKKIIIGTVGQVT